MPRRRADLIADLFHRALGLPAPERDAFVRTYSGDTDATTTVDSSVRAEVLALVEADAEETQTAFRSPLPANRDLDLVPHVPPFRIDRELGEGAMGRVYRAEQLEPVRRQVAIKVLKSTALTAVGRARFQAEHRALARLQHRCIARVLDGGHLEDGRPYLAMDLVDGLPMHRWLQSEMPTLATRLDLFDDLCDAVQHAHGKGIIHRDLKPSNVLVTAGDDGPEPRIIDFGIARFLDRDDGDTMHTGADAAMGTAGYMSPEQAFDAGSADARSDVYALGVILYELLTDTLPRSRASASETAAWHTVPERPSRVRPGTPLDLDWVTLRALAIEPDRRYGTVLELQADVARARRHEPVAARPPTWTYVTRRFLQRHRVGAAASAVGLVLLVTGLVVVLHLWNQANTNWQDFRRLVDDKRLVDLRQEAADELWPPWPEQIPAMRQWERRANALLARRDDLRSRAADLRARLTVATDPTRRDELDYQREVMTRLIDGLEQLAAPAARPDNLAGIRARRAEAERIARLCGEGDLWATALAAIADRAICPAYDGLVLPGLQMGLVPLGIDRASGLWEFWHPESGARPAVTLDEAGKLRDVEIGPESGMVFVLVPAGDFVMGALERRDEHSGEAPIDPGAAPMERFVHELRLAAFFVSKFECTQGQWLRLTGERPSFTSRATSRGDVDLSHPVEQVSWLTATQHLARRRLQLPTEAQWEYFARAGTRSIWACGNAIADLQGFANLCDRSSIGVNGNPIEPGLDDGYPHTAPVGTFRPNAWGLFDVHGNVSEWCRDWLVSYLRPARPGDALREPIAEDDPPTLRMHRGGDFAERAHLSRVASRNALAPFRRMSRVGVRPVRAVFE